MEFQYLSKQTALAKNKYGLWLIENLPNQKRKRNLIFLGLPKMLFMNYDFNAI